MLDNMKIINYSRINEAGVAQTSSITVALPEPTLQVRARLRGCILEWQNKGAELDSRYNKMKSEIVGAGDDVELARRLSQLEMDRLHAIGDYVHQMNLAILRTIVVRSAMTEADVAVLDNESNDEFVSIKDVTDTVSSFRQLLGA